tara:strand:+ start:8745 stop:9614 length:870 start_codon:yes stop_codon:yes gene_type:complete
MIDAGSKLSRVVVGGGVLFVTGVTMVMNAKFGHSLGSDDLEKWSFVALGIGIDICKVLGLAYVMTAFSKKFYLKAVLGLAVWMGCVSYSFIAGIGFAAMTRSNITAEKSYENDKIRDAKQAFKNKVADIERLKNELDLMKYNPRYATSTACSAPKERMTKESLVFCDSYFAKHNEIAETKKEVEILKAGVPAHSFTKDADPQMTFFSTNLGVSIPKMVAIWALYMAIISELVSSVGTFAFSPTRAKPDYGKANKEEKIAKPARLDAEGIEIRRGRKPGSKNRPKLHVVN